MTYLPIRGLIRPLIGQQFILALLPPLLLLCKMSSYWSTAHPSLRTLLLAQMPSDWSTAHQSLTTFLLGNCHLVGQQLLLPSYWLDHPLIGQQLFLALLNS